MKSTFLLRTKHMTYCQHLFYKFLSVFCNNTAQNIMSSHSLHYAVSTSLLANKWHPFKLVKSINNLAEYKKQYSLKWDAMTSATSRPQRHKKFHLSTAPTHFSAFSLVTRFWWPAFLHLHWSKSSAFNFPRELHCIINLTCFSMMEITWYTN